ncbi:MAG: hypothetical protein HYT89_06330 [Candidatus Omnitrophica bacterium]|nr:hypothetical protein [Candidatus Omnitrophota bacterium]
MKNLRWVLALCLCFAPAAPLHAMNENAVGATGALTRDQKMRLSALRYQQTRKRDPVKVLRKLTREEKMRRSALRHVRKTRRKKPAEAAPEKPVTNEEPIRVSDKKAEPRFFFIPERRPPGQGIPAGI